MALSADATITERNSRGRSLGSGTVKTGQTIYKGSFVVRCTSNKVQPASNAGTTTGFLGVALAGAVAGATVEFVYNTEMLRNFKTSCVSQGHIGKAVYAYDDDKITGLYATLGPGVGVLRNMVTSLTGYVAIGAGACANAT